MLLPQRRPTREIILMAIVVCLVLLVGARAPAFLTLRSLSGVLTDTSILAMMAIAQMIVLLTRGIDLSVAANLALTGMLVALLSMHVPALPIEMILVIAIAIGAGLGFVNGALISFVGIPPIVVTLSTLTIFRGLTFVISGGKWISAADMTHAFLSFPRATLLGLSSLVWIAVVMSIVTTIFLKHTRTGRGLYAVGGDPIAAQFCGIRLPQQRLIVYTLAGAVSGLCGYLWVARFGVAYTEIALGYELLVIAACVIGGVSIGGGVGSVTGAVLGALFLGVIVNALPVIGVSPFWQMAISGVVILVAIALNARAEGQTVKLILPEARRSARSRVRQF